MARSAHPTVLLVESDPDVLNLLCYAFEDVGIQLVACRTPEDGMNRLRCGDIDCVLVDIPVARTPEYFGFLSAIQKLDLTSPVPVLATSALPGTEVIRQALFFGVRKFIPKPFYPREILQEVRAALA